MKHGIYKSSEVHPSSYSTGIRGPFPGSKMECDAVPLLPHMPSWYDASLNTRTTLFYKEMPRQIR